MIEDRNQLFSKRRLFLIFLLVVVMALVWFLSNYTWLTINYALDDEAIVSVRQFGEDLEQDRFGLQNESKTILLRKGTYKFRANTKDEVSIYKKSLGFFRDNLDIELMPQQKSAFLGKSSLPCAKKKKSQVLFASCAPLGENNQIVSSKRGFVQPKGRGGFEIDFFNSAVLKDYLGGYLAFWIKNGGLAVSPRETDHTKDLVVADFEGEIVDDWIGISPTGNFAVYDDGRGELISFRDASDENPSKIKLQIDGDYPHSSLSKRLIVSKDYIYLFVLAEDRHEFESSDASGANPNEILPTDAESKVFVYNISSEELVGEHTIPESWEVSKIVASSDNSLLLLVDNFDEGAVKIYEIDETEEPKEVVGLADQAQDVCWKNDDSFYYLTDFGQEIYLFSTEKQASFLVYGGLTQKKINNIFCSSDKVYFNFDLSGEERRVADKYFGYHHYVLTDERFTGGRIESLTPLFVVVGGTGGHVVEVNLAQDSLIVERQIFDERDRLATLSKKEVRKAIISKLSAEGINTEELKFNFAF